MKSVRPSLIHDLRHWAEIRPGQVAYTFLADGESRAQSLTFGQVEQRAQAIAARLAGSVAPGERVLLLHPGGLEFVEAFFGCLLAGIVPAPCYPPRNNRGMERLDALVTNCRASAVLVTHGMLDRVASVETYAKNLAALPWIATDTIESAEARSFRARSRLGEGLAFLQYTSGSTSVPRGVMVSHANVAANINYLGESLGGCHDAVFVSWLPAFHDMGLIWGLLLPFSYGARVVFMPPLSFVQQPARWLRAVSRYRGTHSASPNLGYDLCNRKVTEQELAELDLSSWRSTINGAEPVRPETMARFTEKFAPCGLRREAMCPGYGLAEATVAVSVWHGQQPFRQFEVDRDALEQRRVMPPQGEASVVIGCGPVATSDPRVLIVDPETRQPCAADQVGEIWVAGTNVALGYWGQPEVSNDVFRARLAGDETQGPFLRTGDLGFVLDGQLVIAGRLKDLIIVAGQNHFPHDIEWTVEASHPACRPNCAAAFSIETDVGEGLCVCVETQLSGAEADDVVAAIVRAVSEQHGLDVEAVALLRLRSMPKTSSGKLQRRACRSGFLDGSLPTVKTWYRRPRLAAAPAPVSVTTRSQQEILGWLLRELAAAIGGGVEQLQPDRPFVDYGLDSLRTVALIDRLSQWLGRALTPNVAWDHPDPQRLALHLADGGGSVAAHASAASQAVAIVGLSCRLPGANDPEAFWRLLAEGREALREVPPERWDVDALFDPEPGTPGRLYQRRGGFIDDVESFEPLFFGISPREATHIDPQQRLALELSWEALEDAGITAPELSESKTGVFVGICSNDYQRFHIGSQRPELIEAHSLTGTAPSVAAGRLAYFFGTQGPALAIDTACSSSLVAVHLACESLARGESERAIVVGVNLLFSPENSIAFSQVRALSPDGRCKTFDAAADGYVRSEGAVALVLKPLARAQADGDRIHAVIRATACNQDGRSNGLTAPNGAAQRKLLQSALHRANCSPLDISYVEAHGTGTALGDPIEVNAIGEVLGEGRSAQQPLWIGSVKPNIGHTEATAGLAGLLKTVLMLKHGEIPPNLHFTQPNPSIAWERWPLRVPKSLERWSEQSPRRAAVSSFGISGTNAHAIVEAAPASVRQPPRTAGPLALPVSGSSELGLKQSIEQFRTALRELPDEPSALFDFCWTAAARRTHAAQRVAVVGPDRASLGAALERLGESPLPAAVPLSGPAAVVFVFSGQGGQWLGMGRQLLQSEEVFRGALERCDALVRQESGFSVLTELAASPEHSRLAEIQVVQPVLFSVQVALAELWRSWGIEPAAVIGHSMGEVAAAHVAGALTLADAVSIVCRRSTLLRRCAGRGAMAVVELPLAEAQALIAEHASVLSVAVNNAPRSVVLSGDRAAIDAVDACWKSETSFGVAST